MFTEDLKNPDASGILDKNVRDDDEMIKFLAG